LGRAGGKKKVGKNGKKEKAPEKKEVVRLSGAIERKSLG